MRFALDFLIQCSRHPLTTMVVIGCLWFAGCRMVGRGRSTPNASWRWIRTTLLVVSSLAIVCFVGTGLWYATHTGYASEVEPLVTSVAWWLQSGGGELYHAPGAATQYSVLYGPMSFLITGWVLDVLGPSIPAAKAGVLLALVTAIVLLFVTIRRWLSNVMALGMVAVALLLIWTCGISAFVVRPDAFLILSVCLGLFAAGSPRRTLAVVGSALGIGLAVNFKLHGVLYLLPVLALLNEAHGWRASMAAIALGAVVIVAPFAFHDGISPNNYLAWILLSAHHGLQLGALPHLITRAVFYATPVILTLQPFGRRKPLSPTDRQLLLAWLVGTASVIVLAMKPGAGQVHLLPLIPINLVFAARLWPGENLRSLLFPSGRMNRRGGAMAAFMAAALISGAVSGYRSTLLASMWMAEAEDVTRDIEEIMAEHPQRSIAMGYGGDGRQFRLTYMRPLLVFAGHPLPLDAVSIMDSQRAHMAMPEAAVDAVGGDMVDLWLVPRDKDPFVISNWYPPHDIIFSDAFRARFASTHRLMGHSRFFDIWEFIEIP